MRTLLALLPLLAFLLACGGDAPEPPRGSCVSRCGAPADGCSCEPGCAEEGSCCADYEAVCPAECPVAVAPDGCPPARVRDSVDLQTGCPMLVCGACPEVELPPCEDGTLAATRDDATGCVTAWACVRCEPPPAPSCPGGAAVAVRDPTGCIVDWSCASCPQVEPPGCDDAVAVVDPTSGCTLGWDCPGCPVIEPPFCEHGAPVAETDARGCTTGWSCPGCPVVEPPVCEHGAPVAETDARGCTIGWDCPGCPELPPPACADPVAVTDPASGCTLDWDCPVRDRWEAVEGLRDQALIEGLRGLIGPHRSLGYSPARDEMFDQLDVHDGWIECVYTGRLVRPDGSRTPGGFNTEHTWPQSAFNEREPMRSDLHHLFPTDATANNRRGSYPFGETNCAVSTCTWAQSGSELGPSVSGGGTVFEVRPQNRGDTARAKFYFAVRYTGFSIPAAEEAVLRRWHEEDPPSSRERSRNDGIERLQGNRNPFVDRPDLVGRIGDF